MLTFLESVYQGAKGYSRMLTTERNEKQNKEEGKKERRHYKRNQRNCLNTVEGTCVLKILFTYFKKKKKRIFTFCSGDEDALVGKGQWRHLVVVKNVY